jgi:hypothetical protein
VSSSYNSPTCGSRRRRTFCARILTSGPASTWRGSRFRNRRGPPGRRVFNASSLRERGADRAVPWHQPKSTRAHQLMENTRAYVQRRTSMPQR